VVLLGAVAALAMVTARGELPNTAPGPWPVGGAQSVDLAVRASGPPMTVRVVRPDGDGPFPLIVFSHGMFSANDRYDAIVTHWVSHGYVVLLPNHVDANRAVKPRNNADIEAIIDSRARDMGLVLDHLDDIVAGVPALAGRLGPPPYVAAGHSVGTYVALLTAGLKTRNPQTGVVTAHPDTRYGVVVMSSDPGNMALMPADLWLGVSVPRFLVRGSEDFGVMGDGRTKADYQTEVLSSDEAPAGRRYLLAIDGANHYFGGLVHRQPKDAVPDPEGLAVFTSLSTTFLEAWVRGDQAALQALAAADVPGESGGRASLEIR
jgi:pimeloyl-ACP methyl ester carboxylesterase